MTHIHTLTGLRGLAALIVFVSHSANESLLPSYLGHGFGQIGVMLFFVLSGFLMAYLYIHEDVNGENVRKYMLARIGRVFPLYFALLLFSIVITRYISPESFYPFKFDDLGAALRALLLIEAKYVFWTIPVEVQFYVVFVGFWFLYKKGFSAYFLLLFIILTMLPSVVLYIIFSELPKIVSTYSYAFFLGVLSALLYDNIKHSPSARKLFSVTALPALLLLFVNLPEIRSKYDILVFGDSAILRIWGDPVTWAIVYTVFISAALNIRSLNILNSKFFVRLGDVSYGFYLIHYPVLMFFVVETNIASPAKFSLAFVVTFALSHLSFYFFERPAAKKIRSFGQVKQQAINA